MGVQTDWIGPKTPVSFITNTHLAPLALLGGGHAPPVAEDLLERRGSSAAHGLLVLKHVEAMPMHPRICDCVWLDMGRKGSAMSFTRPFHSYEAGAPAKVGSRLLVSMNSLTVPTETPIPSPVKTLPTDASLGIVVGVKGQAVDAADLWEAGGVGGRDG